MKKTILPMAATLIAALLMSAAKDDGIMTRENGTYVVNTTKLASDVKGYDGATPLKIYIKADKIERVEALENKESPSFFGKVRRQLLDKWNGMKVDKAATAEVDGVTGATFSSKAVKENVRRGVAYYKKHKK